MSMLLSSLLYMFEADTKEIDKGIVQSESGTDKLTDALKRSELQANKTSDTLSRFAKAAVGWLGAAASAGKIMSMAVARAGEVDALDSLSAKLGTSITQTDALARSIVELGGSTQQAQRDLGRLSDRLLRDGIEPMQGMLDLSDELAGMSYGEAAAQLKQFGIVEKSTIDLMRKGRFEIERMTKEQIRNGAITEEAAQKARDFSTSLNKLKTVASDAANRLIQWVMPALTKIIDWLAKAGKWASENKPFVVGFFAAVAAIITAAFLPAMLQAAAATILATWPFIAIGAAIAAVAAIFALIYDDIMNFIDGNESMIGLVLEKYPVVGEIVKWLWELIQIAFDRMVEDAKALWEGMKAMANGIVDVFSWLWDKLSTYIGFIAAGIGKVKDSVGWVAGKLGFGGGKVDVNTTELAKQQIELAGATPMASTTSGAIRNTTTGNSVEQNLSIGEITIETQATDAQGIAADTRSELQDQMKRLQADNASPITR